MRSFFHSNPQIASALKSLIAFLAIGICANVVAVIAAVYFSGHAYPSFPVKTALWAALFVEVCLGAFVLFVMKKDKLRLHLKGTLYTILLASPLILLAFPFGQKPEMPSLEVGLLIVSVSLLVGFVEEVFFRGILLERFGGINKLALSVFATSIIFGLLHLPNIQGDPVAAFANAWTITFAVGVPFACIKLRTGNLTGLILAHAWIDIIALSWLGGNFSQPAEHSSSQIAFSIVFSTLMAFIYWMHLRRHLQIESKESKAVEQDPLLLPQGQDEK